MLLPILALLCTLALPCPLPALTPDSLGLSAARLAAVDRVVRARRGGAADFRAQPWSSAVAAQPCSRAATARSTGGVEPAVSPERTLYDLASLTKVVATTSAVMVLYRRAPHRARRAGRALSARLLARRQVARHDSRVARASIGAPGGAQSLASRAHRRRARERSCWRPRSSTSRAPSSNTPTLEWTCSASWSRRSRTSHSIASCADASSPRSP